MPLAVLPHLVIVVDLETEIGVVLEVSHTRIDTTSVELLKKTDRFEDRGGFQPRERLPLPSKPPYTAHLGNLSYDSTEGDIQDFFTGCAVSSVRIVEDRQAGRPKGFAYVEFSTLEGLKKALELDNTPFSGRTLRISVADPRTS